MNSLLRHAIIVALFLAPSMMQSQPATAQSELVKRTVTYREVDGHEILADVHRPEGNDVRPVIYLYYRQNGIWPREVSGFDLATIAEKITPFEPVRNVTPDYPPTLLIHGTKDTDVPYEQSTMMAKQLKQHGVPFLLKPIMNGEHGFGGGDPREIEDAYRTMQQFIVKHLSAE